MSVKLADTAPYMRGKEDKKEASLSYHGILCAVCCGRQRIQYLCDRSLQWHELVEMGRVSNFEIVHIFVPYNQPVR